MDGAIDEVHCLREAGFEDIVVQIGEAAGGEGKRDSFPMGFLIADVAAPLAGFAFVPPHAVAYFSDRFDNFALNEDGVVGPVREGMHITHFIRDVDFVGEYFCFIASGDCLPEEASLHLTEQFLEGGGALFVGVCDGVESAFFEMFVAAASDSPHFIEGEGVDMLGGIVGGEDQVESFWFGEIGCQFRVCFAGGDADRADQAELAVDLLFQFMGEGFQLPARFFKEEGDVHEILVHGVLLHVGGVGVEDRFKLLADRFVLVVVDLHEDQVGADL